MKYNILDFDQETVLSIYKFVKDKKGNDKKIYLDIADLLIIQVVSDIIHRDKFTKQIVDGRIYYWITYNTILEALPILDIKKQAFTDKIDKIVELGILDKKVIKEQGQGTFTLFRLTDLYDKMKYSNTPRSYKTTNGGSSELPTGVVVDYDPKDYTNNNYTTNTIKEDTNVSKKKFIFRDELIKLGVNDQIVDDWLIVRKNKKSSNTKIAYDAIVREINKSGFSANDCIKIAVERSWCGFNASWLKNIDLSEYSNDKPSMIGSEIPNGYKNDKGEIWSSQLKKWLK